jgi:hypothetical protein
MRRSVRCLAVTAAVSVLCACNTTKQVADVAYHPPHGSYRLIVMEPDIELGLLTAGGIVEPRQDWTVQARESVLKALIAQQLAQRADVRVLASLDEVDYDPQRLSELLWLHKAVGTTIRWHKYSGSSLPTKDNRFDWTLGSEAVSFGTAVHYDYALFLHAENSFESSGRAALEAAGLPSCLVGFCVIAPGGRQSAFASLVDLKTGQIVWFNTLHSAVGDIRKVESARKMVDTLLEGMSSP